MPGLAFHLETLKLTSAGLEATDPHSASLLRSPFAALGAFGPDILLYTPPSAQLADDLASGAIFTLLEKAISHPLQLTQDEVQELQELFVKPFGAAYATVFSQLVVPAWPSLSLVTSFLNQATSIAASQSTSELGSFFAQLPAVQTALTTLGNVLSPGITEMTKIGLTVIALGPWMEEAAAALSLSRPPADPRGCRPYEFLRWHRSGEFARALVSSATTDNQKAFALGWLTHLAASVTAEPFVNNIVGGPYRTHWWRNRLAQNFVDAWTFGFVQTPATMAGDDPSPDYVDWASVCAGNLQDEFNVGDLPGPVGTAVPTAVTAMATGTLGSLPDRFPDEIADLLSDAITATYPAGDRPLPADSLSATTFRQAYVGAFAVFWFLTSGDGPMANNILPPPPSGCGTTAPSWLTPSASSSPPPQQAGSNTGSEVCEILLAILAVLALVTGNVAAGVALLAAALAEAPGIDWGQVQCTVYWINNAYLELENLLRDALVWTALAYPPPVLLGTIDVNGNTHPATDFTNLASGASGLAENTPPRTGTPLTATNSTGEDVYPRARDTTLGAADLHFASYPDSRAEEPTTQNLIPSGRYPDYVLNATGLLAGGILDAGAFPTRGVLFGDAVSNAVRLIREGADKLADYDLDGDRGYGWQGWHPATGTRPVTPPVEAVQG